MTQDTSGAESPRRRLGLLRDQVQLFKRKETDRYEIVPIPDPLSFEKGFFIVIRACQLLAQKNDGIILVGVAGPSGAGKTVFTEKVLNFMPSIAVISMDNYNDSSRIIDGNYDDPRLTDYDTLLENIHGLKAEKPVQVPIYDFKSSSRTGYRTIEVPSSRIVIIEGIYALSERLRPLLDLRVYPMYKAFIEPDLQTAHIKILNKFNPFTGFQNPTYILKSPKTLTVNEIKAVFSEEHRETTEETYDIYLLPPGEDPEACQSYLRMRNRDGKYNLMALEEVVSVELGTSKGSLPARWASVVQASGKASQGGSMALEKATTCEEGREWLAAGAGAEGPRRAEGGFELPKEVTKSVGQGSRWVKPITNGVAGSEFETFGPSGPGGNLGAGAVQVCFGERSKALLIKAHEKASSSKSKTVSPKRVALGQGGQMLDLGQTSARRPVKDPLPVRELPEQRRDVLGDSPEEGESEEYLGPVQATAVIVGQQLLEEDCNCAGSNSRDIARYGGGSSTPFQSESFLSPSSKVEGRLWEDEFVSEEMEQYTPLVFTDLMPASLEGEQYHQGDSRSLASAQFEAELVGEMEPAGDLMGLLDVGTDGELKLALVDSVEGLEPATGEVPDVLGLKTGNVDEALEWVTDIPFIISPRITFEVSVRLLGGLMALGYTIAAILKRSSHVFSDNRVCVKIDWLEQLNRHYVQVFMDEGAVHCNCDVVALKILVDLCKKVQGRDRLFVKFVAEQLGLEGSYIPRTYIEQIQLEKLVNEVMALPDDLKTKLSIDEDLVSSPKEALSRVSADRRNKHLKSGMSHSYSTQGDKNLSKLTRLAVNNRRFDGRAPESPAVLANQGVITQLSEQISTLNERMDEFTSRIEELNSKFTIIRKVSASQQNLALQTEACNGSAPTSFFMSGLGNGSLTGPLLPTSSSSSQLAKEFPLMEEVSVIARGQRQMMHKLDNLSKVLHENWGERSRQGRTDKKTRMADVEYIGVPLILTLAIGGLGIFLFKGLLSRS
ncbi:hypothetical protein HHK36_015116 [Tetracentron sinense]|uniref:Uncharacterized protein n=1 Tax=Tetracentron sinense TaxID=13715 RepID=A0A834Z5J3_TETSI|nr:hypothetical protein HHK36_015116 [Tetracentron sinense]